MAVITIKEESTEEYRNDIAELCRAVQEKCNKAEKEECDGARPKRHIQ